MAFWFLSLSLVILLSSSGVNSRNIKFINSCPFTIDVEGSGVGVVCSNLRANGGSCYWNIPASGWSGQFHRKNRDNDQYGFPSATLAEFTLANNKPSQWNFDWFDISIIPPGCPGTITSYNGCWCNSGADGYDVGMQVKPLACTEKTRICLDRYCSGGYNFPTDKSKTTTCTNIGGSWEVTFCPPGSNNDVYNTKRSQVPPCKGGGSGASKATVDNSQSFNGAPPNAAPVNQTWIWVGVGVGVVVFVALIIGIVVLVTMKKKVEERV